MVFSEGVASYVIGSPLNPDQSKQGSSSSDQSEKSSSNLDQSQKSSTHLEQFSTSKSTKDTKKKAGNAGNSPRRWSREEEELDTVPCWDPTYTGKNYSLTIFFNLEK